MATRALNIVSRFDTGSFDSGAGKMSAGFRKVLADAKTLSRDAGKELDAYRKKMEAKLAPGGDTRGYKAMEGKYAEMQANQRILQTDAERISMESQLYNLTHTQQEITLNNLRLELAEKRKLYANDQGMLSLAEKVNAAQVDSAMGVQPGARRGMFGHGLTGRKLVHAGKFAAGAAGGELGGELGGAIGMGLMVGGQAGVALAGVMAVASAYKSVVEGEKNLQAAREESAKHWRESESWREKESAPSNTSKGTEYEDKARELREKVDSTREASRIRHKTEGTAHWLFTSHQDEKERLRQASREEREANAFQAAADRQGEVAQERQERDWKGTNRGLEISGMAPGEAKDRAALDAKQRSEGRKLTEAQEDRKNKIEEAHKIAEATGKSDRGEKNKYVLALGDAEERTKKEDQQLFKSRALEDAAFKKNLQRQKAADQQNADEAMIGATERGFDARKNILKSHYDYEHKLAVEGGNDTTALDTKYHADTLADQRQEDDAVHSMKIETGNKEAAIKNRQFTNSLRNQRQMFKAEIQEIKDQRDERNKEIQDRQKEEDIQNPQRKAENARKAAADQQANEDEANQRIIEAKRQHAQQVKDLETNTAQIATEIGNRGREEDLRSQGKWGEASQAEIEDRLKEKQDAIQAEADRQIAADATNKDQIQANADVRKAWAKQESDQQVEASGRAARLALHPLEAFNKHKAELDAKVGHGGYTKEDEAQELRGELRGMQGGAGQFFGSGMDRWKSMQTAVANPQETATEQLQVMRKIQDLLSGHGSIQVKGGGP